MNKISVILPVYNVEKYIRKCLDSIINQTFKDFEAILVNDGSTDDSQKIIDEYVQNYPDVFRAFSEDNKGVSEARNFGFKKATGDFVVFVDPDDILSKYFLEELYQNAIKNKCDVSICSYKFVKSQDEELKYKKERSVIYDKRSFLNHFLVRDISFVVVSMLIKRDLILENNIYFDKRIRFSEDLMYMWDIILHSKKIIYTDNRLYGYYLRSNSTMTSSSKEKINNSFYYIKEKLNNLPISKYPELKYALPRWELGALYTSSKLMNYTEFENLAETMHGKSVYKRLNGFKDVKSRLLSFVLFTSNRAFYFICRRI